MNTAESLRVLLGGNVRGRLHGKRCQASLLLWLTRGMTTRGPSVTWAMAVHGGAGGRVAERESRYLAGVQRAAEAGQAVLVRGGTALEAVVAAVVVLEDDEAFNAGTGSVLNIDGDVEMDAAVMVGEGLLTGNVAALRRVKNPVRVAQAVMERTDHVLLAGEGALRFARAMGFADHDPLIERRREEWRRRLQVLQQGRDHYLRHQRLLAEHPELVHDVQHGTVGAVARDRHGGLAAATSTGGLTLKLAGRVGDTPIPGAGNYATSHCAVSATGKGELMLRFLTAKQVCDRAAAGDTASQACRHTLNDMAALGQDLGMIAVDCDGRIGIVHGTETMSHAFVCEGEARVTAAIVAPPV